MTEQRRVMDRRAAARGTARRRKRIPFVFSRCALGCATGGHIVASQKRERYKVSKVTLVSGVLKRKVVGPQWCEREAQDEVGGIGGTTQFFIVSHVG